MALSENVTAEIQREVENLKRIPWRSFRERLNFSRDHKKWLKLIAYEDPDDTMEVCVWELLEDIAGRCGTSKAAPHVVPLLTEIALVPKHRFSRDAYAMLLTIGADSDWAWKPVGLTPEHRQRFTELGVECYEAVNQRIPRLAELLIDEDVYRLQWFPDHAALLLPLIRQRLANTPNEHYGNISSGLIAAALLLNTSEEKDPGILDQDWLNHPVVMVRSAAAFAYVLLSSEEERRVPEKHERLDQAIPHLLPLLLYNNDDNQEVISFCKDVAKWLPKERIAREMVPVIQLSDSEYGATPAVELLVHTVNEGWDMQTQTPNNVEEWQRMALQAIYDHYPSGRRYRYHSDESFPSKEELGAWLNS